MDMAQSTARKDSASEASPVVKGEALVAGPYPSPDSNDNEEKSSASPPAKKSRKRKADDNVATEPSSPKRSKRNRRSTEKAAAASTPKSRKACNASEKGANTHMAPPPPPPPPPPTRLTKQVSNKVQQVKNFLKDKEPTTLDRDPDNRNLVSITETLLQGCLMTMRWHYEVGDRNEASVSDVEEAIISRFKRPVGQSTTDVGWVIIDVSKQTKFEIGIKEKIARHGLDGVNLLEIELDMHNGQQLKMAGLLNEDINFDAERFLNTFEEIWTRISTKE